MPLGDLKAVYEKRHKMGHVLSAQMHNSDLLNGGNKFK